MPCQRWSTQFSNPTTRQNGEILYRFCHSQTVWESETQQSLWSLWLRVLVVFHWKLIIQECKLGVKKVLTSCPLSLLELWLSNFGVARECQPFRFRGRMGASNHNDQLPAEAPARRETYQLITKLSKTSPVQTWRPWWFWSAHCHAMMQSWCCS